MKEYINREKLLNIKPFTICGGSLSDYTEGFLDAIEQAKEAIKSMPAADVKEVVLCQDCRYFGMMAGIPCCQNPNGLISPQADSFCSNGKEKTTR